MATFVLLLLAPLAILASEYHINIVNECGNVEFDVNFMRPTIILYNARSIVNFTITDTMDLSNPMKVTLKENHEDDMIAIDTFHKPLCTKKLLVDVCVRAIDAPDSVTLGVELDNTTICYVEQDKYGGNMKIQKDAL